MRLLSITAEAALVIARSEVRHRLVSAARSTRGGLEQAGALLALGVRLAGLDALKRGGAAALPRGDARG